MAERYIADPVRGLVPADQFYAEKHARQFASQSGLPAPYVVSDVMPETQHPLTGEYYSSKSKMAAVTKAHGYIEVGNDPQRLRPKKPALPDRKAIRASLERARAQINA